MSVLVGLCCMNQLKWVRFVALSFLLTASVVVIVVVFVLKGLQKRRLLDGGS